MKKIESLYAYLRKSDEIMLHVALSEKGINDNVVSMQRYNTRTNKEKSSILKR